MSTKTNTKTSTLLRLPMLTEREFYAGLAMQSLLLTHKDMGAFYSTLADESFEIAEAMILTNERWETKSENEKKP